MEEFLDIMDCPQPTMHTFYIPKGNTMKFKAISTTSSKGRIPIQSVYEIWFFCKQFYGCIGIMMSGQDNVDDAAFPNKCSCKSNIHSTHCRHAKDVECIITNFRERLQALKKKKFNIIQYPAISYLDNSNQNIGILNAR